MTPQRYLKIREIFAGVREQAPGARGAFLESACGSDFELKQEVESLLTDSDEDADFLMAPAVSQGAAIRVAEAADLRTISLHAGQQIGAFRIVRPLAAGGMGRVFEATQDRPKRTVALKVVKDAFASDEVLRRFEYESRILANLSHPGIAQVYAAGTHTCNGESVPYFAMEYISGARNLLEHAEAEGLSTKDRLTMFAKVCDAVQHGHQHGVIHRDLKPANILVDAGGQAKIIDFGVARVTDSDIKLTTLQTDVGQLIGTIAYMSPEQVCGDTQNIDTRSDVYSLGVILYELLTGRLPYDLKGKPIPESLRVIREDEPTRISSINRVFRGDIQTILIKALDKAPPRRYQSAAEFAADIRRHLSNEPITARPPTLLYHLRTLVARHKGASALAAVLLLALASFSIAMTVLYTQSQANLERADKAEEAAEAEAEAATQVSETLTQLLRGLGPLRSGEPGEISNESFTADEIINRTLATMEVQLKDQPRARARLLTSLGSLYLSSGRYGDAVDVLTRALDLEGPDDQADSLQLSNRLLELGRALNYYAQAPEAEDRLREALALRRRRDGEDRPQRWVVHNLAYLLSRHESSRQEAEDLVRHELQLVRQHLGDDHVDVAHLSYVLGDILRDEHDPTAAEELFNDALAIYRQDAAYSGNVLSLRKRLAWVLRARGSLDGAETILREVLAAQRERVGEEHHNVAYALRDVGDILKAKQDYQGAAGFYQEALAMQRRLFGEVHPQVYQTLTSLAHVFQFLGNDEAAETHYRQAFAIVRQIYSSRHPTVRDRVQSLGNLLVKKGDLAGAQQVYEDALTEFRQELGDEHPHVGMCLKGLGTIARSRGNYLVAEAAYREALSIFREYYPTEHTDVGDTIRQLALTLAQRTDVTAAEDFLRDELGLAPLEIAHKVFLLGRDLSRERDFAGAVQAARKHVQLVGQTQGRAHSDVAGALSHLGHKLWDFGDLEQAVQVFSDAHARYSETLGDAHQMTVHSERMVALVLWKHGDYATSLEHYQQVYHRQLALSGPGSERVLSIQMCMAAIIGEMGRYDEGLQKLEEVYSQFRELSGERVKKSVVWLLGHLADILLDRGDLQEAEARTMEALELVDTVFSVTHSARVIPLGGSRLNLAKIRLLQDRLDEAESNARLSIEHFRQWGPEDNYLLAQAKSVLGECLLKHARLDEAEPLLLESTPIIERTFGPQHKRTLAAKRRLDKLSKSSVTVP